ADHDCPAVRKILYSRLHRRKLGVFQVNGSRVVRHLTRSAWVLVVKNRLDGRIQAQEPGSPIWSSETNAREIDQVIQWCIFVNTATDGTINRLVLFVIPNFGGHFRIQIQLILSRTGIIACRSYGVLKAARKSVVMKQEGLVVGNRKTVLTNRGQATGGEPERKLPQRRELVP